MRTLITSATNKKSAAFDRRFGRAAWFCLYDDQTGETEFFENSNVNSSNGAGIKAAEKAVELKVEKVISGDFGPKAKELLEKFEIQMVILQGDDLTVDRIIQKLKN